MTISPNTFTCLPAAKLTLPPLSVRMVVFSASVNVPPSLLAEKLSETDERLVSGCKNGDATNDIGWPPAALVKPAFICQVFACTYSCCGAPELLPKLILNAEISYLENEPLLKKPNPTSMSVTLAFGLPPMLIVCSFKPLGVTKATANSPFCLKPYACNLTLSSITFDVVNLILPASPSCNMPLLSTQAPAEASKVTFLPRLVKPASILPPLMAAGLEYCPATPTLSLVNVPAELIVTPSATVVTALGKTPSLISLPGAIILALIFALPPMTNAPLGLSCIASFSVSLLTKVKSTSLKPCANKSVLIDD